MARRPAPRKPRGPDLPLRKAHDGERREGQALSTLAVHAGERPDPATGSLHTPLHMTSTFLFPELPDGSPAPYIYSRYANPTLEAVEAKLAALEGAHGALLFSSGTAAIQTLCLRLLKPGDTLAAQAGIYGGTAAFFRDDLQALGVRPQALTPAEPPRIRKGTRLVWMESITNPLLRVADVGAWADVAHDAGALLAIDATFASPAVQRPLGMGADLVMHSATKFLGGHSDLIAGALAGNDPELLEGLRTKRRSLGPTLDPHTAFLLGRGAKTLALRVERHCSNALRLAKACEGMRGVRAIHYPGLPSHPDHATARRMLTGGFGGVLTLDLGSLDAARSFRRSLRTILPAASLGGVESLASLPLETSHAYATPQQRKAEGITDGLVRVSVGIEDAGDLEEDVRQAAAP